MTSAMRAAVALAAVLCGLLAPAGAPFLRAEEPDPGAWISVRAVAPSSCRVGERVTVRCEVRLRTEPLRRFAVPLSRRAMDVPVQVQAAWLPAPQGTRPLPGDAGGGGVTFAVNDQVVRGEIWIDEGAGTTTLAVASDVVPTATGRIVLSAPRVRLSLASRYDEDALGARVPLDVREAVVPGTGAEIEVRPLPDAGRPAAFTGAVGRFRASAHVFPRAVKVGESIRVTVTVDGDGDLAGFAAPASPVGGGFDVLGVADDRGAVKRTIVYDLSPTSPGTLRTAFVLPTFDPTIDAWRDVRAELESVEVSGDAVPQRAPPGTGPSAPPPSDPASGPGWTVTLLAAAILGAIGFALGRRRGALPAERAPAVVPPSPPRRDEPSRDDPIEWIAWRTDGTGPSVVGPGLARRLAELGADSGTAGEAAALVERAVAARYGAPAGTAPTAAEIRAIVARLDACLRRGSGA